MLGQFSVSGCFDDRQVEDAVPDGCCHACTTVNSTQVIDFGCQTAKAKWEGDGTFAEEPE